MYPYFITFGIQLFQMNTNTKTSKIHPKSPTFSNCSTPQNKFAIFSSQDSTNLHNQRNSTQLLGFKNKVSMLRTASNRLKQQHQSLAQIQTHQFKNNVISRFKQFIGTVDVLGTKICALKQNLRENTLKLESKNNIQKHNYDQTMDKLQQSLNLVRKQSNQTKNQHQAYGQMTRNNVYHPISQVERINNYAQQIIQQTISNYEATQKSKIKGQLSLALEQQKMSQYWDDIQSDLGLLLCQMSYLKSKHEFSYKQTNLIDENFQFEQLEDIERQFQHYISQTQSRINYRSQKLKHKMQHLKACIFKNKDTKYRHSPTNCTHGHYQQSPKNSKSLNTHNSSCLLEKYSLEIKTIDAIHKQLEQENDGLIFGSYLLIQKYKEIRKSLERQFGEEYELKQRDLLKQSQRINKLVEDSQQRFAELKYLKCMVEKL